MTERGITIKTTADTARDAAALVGALLTDDHAAFRAAFLMILADVSDDELVDRLATMCADIGVFASTAVSALAAIRGLPVEVIHRVIGDGIAQQNGHVW